MKDNVQGPIDCQAVVQKLWDYLDGELPESAMQSVAGHLRECLRCRSHAEFEQALLDHLGAVRQEPADLPALEHRVRTALAAAE